MYAIVNIQGQQFKVTDGQEIYVHRMKEEAGKKVEFSDVVLTENDGKVKVGSPNIKGAKVTATVLEHLKDDKVLIFKKRRRKGYEKLNGHRQYLTKIQINKINFSETKKAKTETEKA
ncbi:MAG: 50S ribosomal protein L21 [Bacteroidia bacterium]|nr:50S ribosomal protein L21 [Bacteroidia bacterium]